MPPLLNSWLILENYLPFTVEGHNFRHENWRLILFVNTSYYIIIITSFYLNKYSTSIFNVKLDILNTWKLFSNSLPLCLMGMLFSPLWKRFMIFLKILLWELIAKPKERFSRPKKITSNSHPISTRLFSILWKKLWIRFLEGFKI